MLLKGLLFTILPVLRFKVEEDSMFPILTPGTIVLANKLSYLFTKPKINEIVVVQQNKKYLIKRIAKIEKDKYFVTGDNKNRSIDSRHFGWIEKKEIIGKVTIDQGRY